MIVEKESNIVITGPTSGAGKHIAKKLSEAGNTLILIGRNPNKLQSLVKELGLKSEKGVIYKSDLSSLQDVKKVAKEITQDHTNIHGLINNAGILGRDRSSITSEGFEETFLVNYLSHFYLTQSLLPLLIDSGDGKIINMSSQSHAWFSLDLEDLQSINNYKPMKAYGRSKLLLLMMGIWLSENFADRLKVYNIDPGTFRSGIDRSRGKSFRLLYQTAKSFMRSPETATKDVIRIFSGHHDQYPSGSLIKKGKVVPVNYSSEKIQKVIEQSADLSQIDLNRLTKLGY